MDRKTRLGIVGAGRIAATHLEVLRGVPDVEVVGITSRTATKAQSLSAKFGVPMVNADLDGLVHEAQPDGLLILVSVDQLYDVTSQALAFGLPLFVEKPAGIAPNEIWKLAHLAREHRARTMVGYNRRFYSVFRKGIEIIKECGPLLGVLIEGHERIAQIREKEIHPERILASWLYANSTHTIDLLRFFGGEPDRVDSIAHRYQEAGGDQFAAIVSFKSGSMGSYISHWLSPGGWRVVLYGQGVMVEFRPLESGRWMDNKFQVHEIEPDSHDVEYKPGFYRQMIAFCELVRGKALEWPGQDLEGAYRTMCLAQQFAAQIDDRALLET